MFGFDMTRVRVEGNNVNTPIDSEQKVLQAPICRTRILRWVLAATPSYGMQSG